MPAGLSIGAVEWWNRTVPMLVELGVATEADRDALLVTAETWAALQDAIVAMQCNSLDKNVRCAFVQLQEAWSKWAGKFGLTPADRAKLQVQPKTNHDSAEHKYFG